MKFKRLFTFCLTILCAFVINIPAYSQEIDPPEIVSPSAVLIDAKTGIILYDKNMGQRNFPASITKIMTALLILEKYENSLDERVPFSYEAVFSLPYGSSHIAMDEGETLTVEQALYGLMLASANEVANALAEKASGSVEEFAKDMSARAKALGALRTNFTNPHGLHDEGHYSTAYDMAIIMQEAIKHPMFLKLISTMRYEIPPTEKQTEIRYLINSNKMIQSNSQYYNEDVIGSKTGYTNEAMHTLVTYGEKDGIELIASIMHDEKSAPYTDTAELLNYGFTLFEEQTVINKLEFSRDLSVMQQFDDTIENIGLVKLVPEKNIEMLLPKNALEQIVTKVELPASVMAPIAEGDKIGSVQLLYNMNEIAKVDLIAADSILPIDKPSSQNGSGSLSNKLITPMLLLFFIIIVIISLLIIILSWLMLNRQKRHTKFAPTVYSIKNFKYKND